MLEYYRIKWRNGNGRCCSVVGGIFFLNVLDLEKNELRIVMYFGKKKKPKCSIHHDQSIFIVLLSCSRRIYVLLVGLVASDRDAVSSSRRDNVGGRRVRGAY